MTSCGSRQVLHTSVNSLNSAASASLSSALVALTIGLISFLRPLTRFLGFAVAGANLSIKTVDKQSRNVSKLDSSSEEIISQKITIYVAHSNSSVVVFASRSPKKQDLVCLASDLDVNSMLILRSIQSCESLGNLEILLQARSIMASATVIHASIIITTNTNGGHAWR